MGSKVSGIIMHTPAFLILIGFSFLGSVLSGRDSVDCFKVSLANVRKVIPDDAVNAKNFLYKIWKLSKKDFCQSTFEGLIEMPIFHQLRKIYGKKIKNDVTLSNIVKYYMDELFQDYEKSIWRQWVNDHGSPQMPVNKQGLTDHFNLTMHVSIMQNIESWSFDMLVDGLIGELEEVVPNLDFLETFTLDSNDMKMAIAGFTCTWQTERKPADLELRFSDAFDEMMEIKGVENVDIQNTKEVVRNFLKNIIETEINPFITRTSEKLRAMVYNLTPEMTEFHLMKKKLLKGENIELENYIKKIPGKLNIQALLGPLFNDVCAYRNKIVNDAFSKSLKAFFHLARQRVNENKKVDFNGMIDILIEHGGADHYIKVKLAALDKFVDEVIANIENGKYALDIMNYVVELINPYPVAVASDRRSYYEEKYDVRPEAIMAGAVQYFVEYYPL